MCGIAGIISHNINQQTESHVWNMLKSIQHRGPDFSNIFTTDNCVLGHNRLSIIDLSVDANQPMTSNCGRYTIVYNGEIYNYQELRNLLKYEYDFKTHSDTEVILAAFVKFNKDVLNMLNGMFSFLLWDNLDEKVFVARDRFGVKPFYYTIQQGEFYFGSEIKALFAGGIKKEKHWKVWSSYLTYGTYGLPNETFWQDIHQLPGGHFLEIQVETNKDLNYDRLTIGKWYDFIENVNKIMELDEFQLRNKYFEILNDSIKLRFIADVKVGFNISGGLDSSLLLALVNKNFPQNEAIEAFTFYSDNREYDELPWVEQMITQTKNPLNKCLLDVNEVENLINEVSFYQDEPFGGFPTMAYSLIFKEASKKNILVLLDGQGMDEAWAGYDYYQNKSGFNVQGSKTSPVRPEVLNKDFRDLAEKDVYPISFDDQLKNLQYRDIFYTKIPRALRFNDRVSMMHSTELREPFLDYRLVELAFAQKESVKIQNGQSKWMLRQLVGDLLIDKIALAPKRPLQTPQREWISNELKNSFSEKINQFSKLDFIDNKNLSNTWQRYLNGEDDNSFYVWQWINTFQLVIN
jgi:asparagine synthase (glutamine-hydrolysing)